MTWPVTRRYFKLVSLSAPAGEPYARADEVGEPATTNNRMELQAAISALKSLKESCEVTLFTDSEYLRGGITEWLPRWKANHWLTVERKPVKNDGLWRQLDEATSRHRVTWQWLKGHVGHPDNERCDQLAAAEILKVRRNYTPEQVSVGRTDLCSAALSLVALEGVHQPLHLAILRVQFQARLRHQQGIV